MTWWTALCLVVGCDDGATADGNGAERGIDASPAETERIEGVSLQFDAVVLPLVADENAGPPQMEMAEVQVLAPDYTECPAFQDDCSNNGPLVLGEPIFVINDLRYPDLSDVRNGDSLAVLVPVEDAECNLACGTNWSSMESERSSGTGAASLPVNVPCSTSDSGVYLGLALEVATISGPGNEGRVDTYAYRLGVTDRCGARSEAWSSRSLSGSRPGRSFAAQK